MIKTVVFDIGGVLLDWNPRYLYRRITDDEEEIEKFLSEVCTPQWNHTLDLERPWEDARAELVSKFPEKEEWIDAYWTRWLEMFEGPIHESVDILMELKRMKFPVYALSNWNAEKFVVARKEFPFLNLFDDRILSGDAKLAKPDPAIYKLLLDRFSLDPKETFFVDDRPENVDAARDFGIEAVLFTTPFELEKDLIACGVFSKNDDNDSCECGGTCSCHSR